MSEENLQTATRFAAVWVNNPLRATAELTSFHNETNRLPDRYHLIVGVNGFIDPETNLPVETFITDKTSYTGKAEFGIYEEMIRWAERCDEGIAIWFSPALESIYPCNKVIVSKITYDGTGQKVILNGAVLFGNKANQCIEAASLVLPEFKNVENAEVLRNTLITKDDDFDLTPLSKFLSSHLPSNGAMYLAGVDDKVRAVTAMIRRGDNPSLIAQEMQRQGLIGPYSISCPPVTFSEYVLGKQNIIEAKFVKNCGKCGKPINTYISKGYKCSCGGVYEGC